MILNQYIPGQVVKIIIELLNDDAEGIDPTDITLRILIPGVEEITKTLADDDVIREDDGKYFYLFDTTDYEGMYVRHRWETTGEIVTAQEGKFKINNTDFALT